MPSKLKTVYSLDMVAESGPSLSPSARKPRLVAEALLATGWPIEIVPPVPMAKELLYRVHDPGFVDSILSLARPNGFGTASASVSRSLTFTCGGFHTAALIALHDGLSSSLTSGFHHARHARAHGFCTFNGLMASAMELFAARRVSRLAILDCDYHFGDGTESIIEELGLRDRVLHVSVGPAFRGRGDAALYLAAVARTKGALAGFKPDLVFYQAGVDPHIDDPLGGLLTTEELRERDRLVFAIAHDLGLPLTWNLAGGYQVSPDGTLPVLVELHLNTFQEALRSVGYL